MIRINEIWYIPKPGDDIKLGIQLVDKNGTIVVTIPPDMKQDFASLLWQQSGLGMQKLWAGQVEATNARLFYANVRLEGHKLLIKGPDSEISFGIPTTETEMDVLVTTITLPAGKPTNWLAWIAGGVVVVGLLWGRGKRKR